MSGMGDPASNYATAGTALRFMEDNRWSKRIITWSPEGRRGRPEMKWERKVERVKKQKNLTPEKAVNRQLRRKVTENQ
jgi:adenine C2-methylase RlmN of 23S rRNA A2503 and tRNA A37